MYGHVNWDNKVPKKLHAPITTYEYGKPDPLKPGQAGSAHPQIYQVIEFNLKSNKNKHNS